mgnify:CR=1 FL=1
MQALHNYKEKIPKYGQRTCKDGTGNEICQENEKFQIESCKEAGTDLPEWFKNNNGLVIGGTINKYIYIHARYLPNIYKYNFRL